MKEMPVHLMPAITIALPGLSAYAQETTDPCPRNETLALHSLSNESLGHIVLMRHGKTEKGVAKDPPEGTALRSCSQKRRHISDADKIRRMGELLRNLRGPTGLNIEVSEVYSSEVCRAEETAFALGLLPHKTQAKLNPPAEGNSIQQAANWISTLEPGRGTFIVLVSHSNVIPEVVKLVDRQLAQTTLQQTERVVLKKEDDGFKCVATIPAQ